ncbi:MAG: pentapeptide repeat-containing protein [Bifidobacteriaceae bacterium]|nr:pentapeptide repeat-containing protein [Bifidobacteriaceae bacterium]
MTDQIDAPLDELFAGHADLPGAADLRHEIGADLRERFADWTESGLDREAALAATAASIGDLRQTLNDLFGEGADAPLAGPSQPAPTPTVDDGPAGATSGGADLTLARLNSLGLRGTDFTTAILVGTQFKYCDLRGAVFDGDQLDGVAFNAANLTGASMRRCVLNQVSFRHVSKRAVASIAFEGSRMDRLTHTQLLATWRTRAAKSTQSPSPCGFLCGLGRFSTDSWGGDCAPGLDLAGWDASSPTGPSPRRLTNRGIEWMIKLRLGTGLCLGQSVQPRSSHAPASSPAPR